MLRRWDVHALSQDCGSPLSPHRDPSPVRATARGGMLALTHRLPPPIPHPHPRQLIIPSGSTSPPALTWHHTTTAQGCIFIAGDGPGGNFTYRYNPPSNAWDVLPVLPASFRAPSLVAIGGWLAMFGGETDGEPSDTLIALPLGNTAAGWSVFTASPAPAPRNGHRVVSWAGIAYLFGGWDQTQYYNDLWALDLATYFASNQTTGWMQLLGLGTPGMPSARNSFSWDIYSTGIIMFGVSVCARGPKRAA